MTPQDPHPADDAGQRLAATGAAPLSVRQVQAPLWREVEQLADGRRITFYSGLGRD